MGFIPHPEIPLASIRSADMFLLLVAGATWEILLRAILWNHKKKPTSVKLRELKLKDLEKKVKISRDKGIPAFVETSKLERQMLAEEKELAALAEARQADLAVWEKLSRNLNLGLCAIILFVYYGIPLLEFSPLMVTPPNSGELFTVEQAAVAAERAMQSFLFPLSFVGIGVRISKWGLANPKSSVGALLVFWSAQTTMSKILDGVEALLLI